MNLENQGNAPDSSANFLIKRKRGRPRKDQSQSPAAVANVLTMRGQIQGRPEYAPVSPVPPGFATSSRSLSHQGNEDDHNDNTVVGKSVTGVIEAIFGAGYLLSVRIGNSETSLRGVVFKPGHYVPVSTENDVVPHMKMVRRNVVPSPVRDHTPVHGSYRRGRVKSESRFSYSANGSSNGNYLPTYSGKQMQIVPFQPANLFGDRGTVVPVVLQPANLSNGAAPVVETLPLVSQPAHLAASKAKMTNQTKTSPMGKNLKMDNDFKLKLPGELMGESTTEAVERTRGSSQLKETQNESYQSCGSFTPEQIQDFSQALMVEPLQTFRSDPFGQSSSISKNFREAGTGKMTELLMAVQENFIDKQATDMQPRNN